MVNSKLALDLSQTTHSDKYMQSSKHIRLVKESDIPVILNWWQAHRKDEFIPEMLSNLGVMVEGEAVGFLYETNSPRCFADYCIVNPALPKTERDSAINTLMDALIGVAIGRKFRVMEIMVCKDSLHQRCLGKGFIDLGEVTYMGRDLWLAQ